MLSVESLSKYLNEQQTQTSKRFELQKVLEEERHIYDSYILEDKYEFLNKKIEKLPENIKVFLNQPNENYSLICDTMKKNTFFSAILNSIMSDYRHFTFKSRLEFIKKMFQQMSYDLNEKNLYNAFNYNKNHKFSLHKLEKYLKNIQEYDFDAEEYEIVRQYFVDYLSLNVYVIFEEKEKFNMVNCVNYKYQNKNFETEYKLDKYNPSVILVKRGERYSAIIEENSNGTFLYNEHNTILNFLQEKSKPYEQEKKTKKVQKCRKDSNSMFISLLFFQFSFFN